MCVSYPCVCPMNDHLAVVGQLLLFNDPKSYAGGNITTPGRATHAQAEGYKPDEVSFLVLQVGGGSGGQSPTTGKNQRLQKPTTQPLYLRPYMPLGMKRIGEGIHACNVARTKAYILGFTYVYLLFVSS